VQLAILGHIQQHIQQLQAGETYIASLYRQAVFDPCDPQGAPGLCCCLTPLPMHVAIDLPAKIILFAGVTIAKA
jgi:hypothetical protein